MDSRRPKPCRVSAMSRMTRSKHTHTHTHVSTSSTHEHVSAHLFLVALDGDVEDDRSARALDLHHRGGLEHLGHLFDHVVLLCEALVTLVVRYQVAQGTCRQSVCMRVSLHLHAYTCIHAHTPDCCLDEALAARGTWHEGGCTGRRKPRHVQMCADIRK